MGEFWNIRERIDFWIRVIEEGGEDQREGQRIYSIISQKKKCPNKKIRKHTHTHTKSTELQIERTRKEASHNIF